MANPPDVQRVLERRLAFERTPAGVQTVLPGAGRDGGSALVRNIGAAPLKGRAPQKPCDVGLFDDAARDQLNLL